MKKSVLITLALWTCSMTAGAKLNYHDTLPVVSSIYPFDFLNSDYKAALAKDLTKEIPEIFQITTFAYMQHADSAKKSNGDQVPAGEVHGRLGLLALTYGSTPASKTASSILTSVAETETSIDDSKYWNDTSLADPAQNLGFLSIPSEYKKIGARFSFSGKLFNNFIVSVQGGVCDMRQSVTGYTDRTSSAVAADLGLASSGGDATNLTSDKLNLYNILTRLYKDILTDAGINYSDWHAQGIEDATLSLTWRGNIPVQQESETRNWTKFVIIPHITLSAIAGCGETKNPDILLSLPFGNNGHHAFDLSGGLAFAFNDTIEVFGQAGLTQFSERRYSERVPTSIYQSGVYQYKTDIKVQPASTVHASGGISAHYFIDRLSGYVQASYGSHEKDTIELVKYDAAYKVARLAQDTEWKHTVMNIGLTYDLSPNVSLGGVVQIPISQRATYITNTFGFGINGTF